ncbi:hypothetical protein [Streptomyces chumphonensis]|uniref:hypothetical protein n=1 Tax=Streptomyces chumphonensis TaxID=1214925 RepID=UPI003D731669
MDGDDELALYGLVADRLKEAHRKVRALQVPEGEREALTRKLLVITAAAKHDLASAAQRLERLMEEIDGRRFPSA